MNSIWIARDKNGLLYAYKDKPVRDERTWTCQDSDLWCQLDESWFPCLNWEDDPIELASRQDALDALDRVLGRWVHGGDADCIVSEFEEEFDKMKDKAMKEFDMEEKELTYEELKHYYHSTVGLWAIDRSPQEVTLEWIVLNAFQLGIEEKHSNSEKIGQNLKPFDLQKAKEGKPVCTRDGRKARILCYDFKQNKEYPILVAVENKDGKECALLYSNDGISEMYKSSNNELMLLPKKKEGWVNVYKKEQNRYVKEIFPDKETAINSISEKSREYMGTIKVEWEE